MRKKRKTTDKFEYLTSDVEDAEVSFFVVFEKRRLVDRSNAETSLHSGDNGRTLEESACERFENLPAKRQNDHHARHRKSKSSSRRGGGKRGKMSPRPPKKGSAGFRCEGAASVGKKLRTTCFLGGV